MLSSILLDELPEFGMPGTLPANQGEQFGGGFAVRIVDRAVGSIPFSSNPDVDGYVIAFGATCPHMGCRVTQVSHRSPAQGSPESLVTRPCPCHGSTFDLTRSGLVVLGPATQSLPQLELRLSADGQMIEAVDWLHDIDPTLENWPSESA